MNQGKCQIFDMLPNMYNRLKTNGAAIYILLTSISSSLKRRQLCKINYKSFNIYFIPNPLL